MLDIKTVRERTDEVRANIARRQDPERLALLDEVLAKDAQWRARKGSADGLRAQRNKVSQRINEAKKAGADATALLQEAKAIPQQLKELEEESIALEGEIRALLMRLPNLMHESVPYGPDDSGNETVKEFGRKPSFGFTPRNHTEIIEQLGIVDLERASKIAGSRMFFLKGDLARLDLALQQYAMDFLSERNYTPVLPPLMMNRAAYEGVTDLRDFGDVLYKVQDEDLHLIATSEHPLTAQFMDETIEQTSLPIRLAGLSQCFRKEAGSHGKEEKGIWRVHQFTKIEQIIICKPQDSWALHEELIANAIAFFESLGLAFRQVLICTGDLGIVAAKKYDLEAWIPSVHAYKEVVSCSNCTAYQAVRLNIRYHDGGKHEWAHTLNSTCVATSRALVAILEQFQQEDGSVLIPPVLRKYLRGQERITALPRVQTC